MQMIESDKSEIASLRKQIRLLAIVLFGACVLLLSSLIKDVARHPSSDTGWPDLSANKLQAKQVVLMTEDGKPAGVLKVIDGASGIALLDSKGEVRILLTTAKNSGLIELSGEGAPGSTFLRNGEILMGDEKTGGLLLEGPPQGGPDVKVFDNSGYAAVLGRSAAVSKVDGAVTETSAASLTGISNDRVSRWALMSPPVLNPPLAGESREQPPKTSPNKPSKDHN